MAAPTTEEAKFDEIIAQLSLAEKVCLLSGAGACRTNEVPRLGIPRLETSDGPHGLRGGGGRFFNMPPGYQLPCATAIGATFDIDLAHRIGNLLGDEGRRKGIQVALAPTVCIQRSPLIGRGFEAFAEDPVLSGTLARHYIEGLQERGVAACIKHYAAHDQSTDAKEDDVHMTQRTLREMHLLPFQLALRADPRPWAVMAAYQKINGVHVSEDPLLLEQVLRREWGFDGLVMSDWWGTYSVSEALNAGLDLEMPGPSIWRGRQLMEAVECRKVPVKRVDGAVRRLLQLIERTRPSRGYTGEAGGDTPQSRALARKVAAESIVLLRNRRGVLPLGRAAHAQTYGLIGEHFENPATCGGGSSETMPFYVSTPLDAVREVLGEEQFRNVRYEPGCYTRRWTPLIQKGLYQPQSRNPGLVLEWFLHDPSVHSEAPCLYSTTTTHTSMYFSQIALPNVPADSVHYIRITTTFITDKTCKYRFALSVCGKARLNVNRTKAIDLWADHPEKTDDTPCFNKLSMERHAVVEAQEGQEYSLEILMTNEKPGTRFERPSAGGVRLGGQVVRDDEDTSIADAVELAKSVDIPILLTGLSSDYEYEASDRASLVLPRRENELIQRVCEANPNTVVIIQAGMPIEMPWLESVNTLVYAWYGGQEAGRAIADVLWGATSPSGRLSLTFPKRLQDTPAFLNFGKTDRGIVYGEGVFVGYRYYEKLDCPPLFYFGYGLSYTGFKYSNLSVPAVFPSSALGTIGVSVDLENIGPCMGSEVVQIYVSDLACSVQRPRKELKAFDKVSLDKGEKTTCKIVLDKYAVSFWSEEDEQWKAEAGEFAVIVATSADPRDEQLQAVFRIESGFTWGGV